MEIVAAVEQRRPIKETPLERLLRELRQFLKSLARLVALSLLLLPILLWGFLSVDLPVRGFDQFFTLERAKPGNWLSLGLMTISLAPFLIILIARRFGGEEASRVVTMSWCAASLAAFAGYSYLAPSLDQGDMPSVAFTVAFVLSAAASQFMAAGVYDITRGGEAWWRAPLFAALAAFVTQGAIYFPVAYWRTNAPWLNWFAEFIALASLMTVAFLGVYWSLMKSLRPRGGYGG